MPPPTTQNAFLTLITRTSGTNHFQYRMFVNFMLKWVMAAMILFSLNFFYYVPEFTCTENEMQGWATCEEFVCSKEDETFWVDHMQGPLPKSISLDYGVVMVCSKEWVASLLQSFSYMGSFAGYLVMPLVADNKGRKLAEFIAWVVTVVGCFVLLIAPNLVLVGVSAFMMGFGANGAINLHYSFIKQLVQPSLSQRMMIFLQVSFSLGIFFIAMWSWVIDDWKIVLGLTILLPSALLFFTQSWIEETPEFTLSKGEQNFVKSMNKISQMNHAPSITLEDIKQSNLHSQRTKGSSITFFDLFKYKSLLKLTIICALIDFIIEFTFDGTILSLSKIGINVYLDQMLVGILEAFAAFFATFIVSKVERKKFCQWSFVLISLWTSILGVLSMVENHQNDKIDTVSVMEMIVLGLLRITLNCVWGVFFVFIAQLYPAEITSVSFGWVSIVGNIGATISPFIRLATAQLTLFLMAVLNIISAFLIRYLKQTKGLEIRLRIEEREQNGKTNIENENGSLISTSFLSN